ncbi:MAG: hypothetical protein KF832_16550 [Caldilineaceae bacterium]|nr:hypothetical protein [Caldilineaceae bacterium]
MPSITRLFLKTALFCFVAALLCGLLLALRPLVAMPAFVAGLTPVYFHLFMVGWVTQMIIGVAIWMFPKHTKEQPRGSEGLAWSTYLLLNSGLLLRTLAEPLLMVDPWPIWRWLLVSSALLQWLGGLTFVVNSWPRIKER